MTATMAEQVERYCARAGMPEDEPLRQAMVSVAQSADSLQAAADRIGREAAGRAATAAVAECRSQMVRVAREVSWIRRLAVAGLVRAGHTAAAARIAEGLVAAASTAGGRLPEVLTGLARRPGQPPVPYPHSCSPQAWAAAAPLLLQTVLS